jgi:hypothetical protein
MPPAMDYPATNLIPRRDRAAGIYGRRGSIAGALYPHATIVE